jgi:predicted PurR-regulated permease PerM
MPDDWYEALAEPTKKIAGKLGAWLRSQLLLMIIVGVFTGIGLVIIGVPYALTLAVWSGLTEGIPIIGPWLGAIAGVSVGLSQSPLTGFLALIVYLVVQQTESNLLVPKIMSRAVGVNPVVVILAVLIGGKLYGILGIMLGVPFAAVLSVVVEDWAIIRSAFAPAKHNS